MNLNEKITEFKTIISNSKNPFMFFDTDTDGATSYLQLKKTFPQIKGMPLPKNPKIQQTISQNINNDCDLVIFFDTSLITNELLDNLKNKQIILCDHHPITCQEQIKKYNINYLNPLQYNPNDNRPSSYFAYKITNNPKNLELAVLGSIADFFLLDIIEDFYNYDSKAFDILFQIDENTKKKLFDFIHNRKNNTNNNSTKSEHEKDDWIRYLIYKTNIIKLKNLIDFTNKLKETEIKKTFEILGELTIKEILKDINYPNSFLFENLSKMLKTYNNFLQQAINTKYNKNLFFFEYSGEIGYSGALSEEISYKIKTPVTCICYNKTNKDYYTCSLRGRDYNVKKLIKKALENLDGDGGGHPFAVGMNISTSDFPVFKKRIQQILLQQ